MKKLKAAYHDQMYYAADRNIEWKFTFDIWLKWWEDSGHLHERGQGRGKYCMARHGDIGPYSPENVKCILIEDNSKERHVNKPTEVKYPPNQRARICRIHGIEYPSITSAGEVLGKSPSTLWHKINRHDEGYEWVGPPVNKKCMVKGVEYPSLQSATADTGILRKSIISRIKNNVPGYKWLD